MRKIMPLLLAAILLFLPRPALAEEERPVLTIGDQTTRSGTVLSIRSTISRYGKSTAVSITRSSQILETVSRRI